MKFQAATVLEIIASTHNSNKVRLVFNILRNNLERKHLRLTNKDINQLYLSYLKNLLISRFDNFIDKISYIDFHEISDKIRTLESLRNLLTAEYNNYIETLDIVHLPLRKQLSTYYYTRKHFIEKLINLLETLPVRDYPEEHIENITISKD